MNNNLASSILKKGEIINTKSDDSSIWHQNIVLHSNKDVVYIKLLDCYIQNMLMIDDNIKITYANEYFQYYFEGKIIDINPQAPSFVKIKILKCEECINTRAYPRFYTYLPCKINFDPYTVPIYAIVNNVSFGGMSFFCKEKLIKGEICSVALFMNDGIVFKANGRILDISKTDKKYRYNMQFTELDDDNSIIMSKFISMLLKSWINLEDSIEEINDNII